MTRDPAASRAAGLRRRLDVARGLAATASPGVLAATATASSAVVTATAVVARRLR
jgi:hypothetical protein